MTTTLTAMPGTVQELIDEMPDNATAAVIIYVKPDPEHPYGDAWETRWSNMKISDLCFASAILQRQIALMIKDD